MCGIAGIISANPGAFTKKDVLAMAACVSHRGPDAQAAWQNPSGAVLFAHNRLSIIDLTAAANQPLHYLDRYTIIHNGEVYNYQELRKTLETTGYAFQSQSDTEVIVAAYDRWKENCLQHFDGMFAFAIWDEKERCLFAARDRFGEKPFYFHFDEAGKTLCFASELKAFYQVGFRKSDVNGNLLLHYLTTGVGYTADTLQTFHRQILKLPARHYLRFAPYEDDAALQIQPYYDLDKMHQVSIDNPSAIEQFRAILSNAINLRLRSDVPLGTSLSGGIDSASVAATIHQLRGSSGSLDVFTASFPGFARDETARATLVAQKFGLRHHYITPNAHHLVDDLEKFLIIHDEPVSSASVYAQYKVYQAAREQGVKVILDGQGADEMLAGYRKYYHWYLQELFARKQYPQLAEETAALGVAFGFKNKLAARFPSWAAIQLERRLYRLQKNHPDLHPDFIAAHINRHNIYKPVVRTLNDMLYADVFNGALEELLRNADRNAMAHGVEVRLPFLSHPLVEFAFSLPAAFKINKGYSKMLLRQAMENQLPAEIVWQKDKTGFEPPQQKWMQDTSLQERIHAAKEKLVKEKILHPTVLSKKIAAKAAHESGNFDWWYLCAAQLY